MVNTEMLRELFDLCLTASQTAGNYIIDQLGQPFNIDFKGRADMVTHVDRTAEEMIIQRIHNKFPTHQILAEESDEKTGDSDFRWIIDPLDGTTNFVHGFPVFSVSIALQYKHDIVLGAVFDPTRRELFSAVQNNGAYLNRKPIRVSKTNHFADSLTSTGFPYKTDQKFHLNMAIFKSVYQHSQGVRRAGSAALDLCYVASGRFDGFWEFGLNPWDVSAGLLIVKEAGGKVSNFNGNELIVDNASEIVATNGLIHQDLIAIINENIGDEK